MPAPCYSCGADVAPHAVDEVWFDFGESNVRFCSSKDLYKDDPDEPTLPAGIAAIDGRSHACDACKKEKACLLAQAVLEDAHKRGATGPLIPTRWWVRYADGYVIGGDVARPSCCDICGGSQTPTARYIGGAGRTVTFCATHHEAACQALHAAHPWTKGRERFTLAEAHVVFAFLTQYVKEHRQ